MKIATFNINNINQRYRAARYIEAAVRGVIVASIYLPNGNPNPGPKFDYKMAWFKRLNRYAADLLKAGVPIVLAGDFNVAPTDLDIYQPITWVGDALISPEARSAFSDLISQGWTDGLRLDHLLLSSNLSASLRDANVDRWVRSENGASDHAPAWVEIKQ